KHEIVRLGLETGAPLHLTWSCYDNGEKHCGRCGPCYMRSAVITYGITRSDGVAEVRGVGEVILPSSVGEVADALKAGGANVRVVDDIEPYRWLKVIINAAINPITAILRARNGAIIKDPNAWSANLSLSSIPPP
ncbi:7-cyano-7-deazaguanine synthase, partial [Vulcanisaeta souniana]|uniref:7-cyano-7-deazaguanine synthase n=1 Tax=Vulcanisaeta souniana TaxID=164452 RepID=UPI000ACE65C8